ncbi:helicase-related protein [Staphylococcus aureus]
MSSSTRFIVRWYTIIVISPLISLMKDQVDQLKAMGIQAAFLNSSLTQKEQQRIEKALSNGRNSIFVCCTRTI